MTDHTRIPLDKIAYCGHHCGFCPYTDCVGCRSDNPSCSFATLFEDRQCPNVTCARAKGLEGCYECGELERCDHGFYATEERVAKATALFVKARGKEAFHRSLARAIAAGVSYPADFNALASVPEMTALLERYR